MSEAGDHGTTDVDIRILDDPAELRRVITVFNQVWGTATPLVNVELARAIQYAGGYVAAAYAAEQVVGGSLGFLGRHLGRPSLHSHITGILPGVRHTGLGRALKRHQREWAAERGLAWVTWTFDPLVRRNAWFNITVLGAQIHEYLVDFYGPLGDAVNAGDETDRLLVAWAVDETLARPAPAAGERATTLVPTPEDIVVLRRTDQAAAAEWRHQLRRQLGEPLSAGAMVSDFTEEGEYVVVAGATP